MSEWDAFIYGFIQGSSEFLPISSSGHLALLPHFLKIEDPGVGFDLLMHLGTALAVSFYFRKEILQSLRAGKELLAKKFKGDLSPEAILSKNLLLSTLASIALILLLKPLSENIGRNPKLIAFNLIFFGMIMGWCDWRVVKYSGPDFFRFNKSLKIAVFMGLAQAVAIFPGVSRSGITLSAARFMGVDRANAGEFSFLLALPVIYAGVLVHILESLGEASVGQILNAPTLIGLLSSFFFGVITIHFFLKVLGRWGLWPFSLYRFFLGLFLLFQLG